MASLSLVTKGTDFGKSGIYCVDIVKPRPYLPDIFHDEIGRIVTLKLLFVLKRIMKLSKRHGARFEPAVENFLDTREMLTIEIKLNFIDPGAMVVV